MLYQKGLTFDYVKLERDAHWYQTKVQSSKLAEMEFEIADLEKSCMQSVDFSQYASLIKQEY